MELRRRQCPRIDDTPMQKRAGPLKAEMRLSLWRYCRRERWDPKVTDAACTPKRLASVREVEQSDAVIPRGIALMHI